MDTKSILELVEAIRQTTATPPSVSAVAFKSPPFWNTNATAWFLRLEASFATHSPPITNDRTKFYHVVQLLDSPTSRRVQPTIEQPPADNMYGALKATLLDAYEPTQLQKDTALLSINGLGDKRPSEMLQYMKNLNSNPQTLFRALFLSQLPPEVRRILAQNPEMCLEELAKTADRIVEIDVPHLATVTATAYESEVDLNVIRRPTKSHPPEFLICQYHKRFGNKARRCENAVNGRPCALAPPASQGNYKASRF